MAEYIIGIDIGATKSHLALFDIEGNFIDLGHWGPLNYECLPGLYAQLEEELKAFVSGIITRNGITMKQVSYSVLGVGGVDTKKQHSVISKILKRIGFRRFTLVNDAFLGIPAGTGTSTVLAPGGTGICAINGSGCTLAGINKCGDMLQIGGVGFVSDDKGGGSYIGERLVSAVYSELFRKGEPTIMTRLLLKELGITSKYDYVEKIHDKNNDGTFRLGSYNPLVFEAVKHGDPVASKILCEIADNYANGISCMIEELRFPCEEELFVVLAGSVFVKGEHPFLIDTLKAKLSKENPGMNISYILLDVPNVAGAVIWALNELGGNGNNNNKVCSQLRAL